MTLKARVPKCTLWLVILELEGALCLLQRDTFLFFSSKKKKKKKTESQEVTCLGTDPITKLSVKPSCPIFLPRFTVSLLDF